MPGIFESHDLRVGFMSALVFETHVVVAVRIQRRIEINKTDRLVPDIPPQNIRIIAVVKSVHLGFSEGFIANFSTIPSLRQKKASPLAKPFLVRPLSCALLRRWRFRSSLFVSPGHEPAKNGKNEN